MIRPPPRSTLFPSTTLSRSLREAAPAVAEAGLQERGPDPGIEPHALHDLRDVGARLLAEVGRSEEHTSELQSRLHLVCRLLLEKKKIDTLVMHLGVGRDLDA